MIKRKLTHFFYLIFYLSNRLREQEGELKSEESAIVSEPAISTKPCSASPHANSAGATATLLRRAPHLPPHVTGL